MNDFYAIQKARVFAHGAHKAIGQKRKYSGLCYTVHLEEVVRLTNLYNGTTDMVCAAYLHDVVEDTDVTLDDIYSEFSKGTSDIVNGLTNLSIGLQNMNRNDRKYVDSLFMSRATYEVQTVKCCDIIHNAQSIIKEDPDFAKVFCYEKIQMLELMNRANADAHKKALEICKKGI